MRAMTTRASQGSLTGARVLPIAALALVGAAYAAWTPAARADATTDSRAIRLIVGTPPGSGVDFLMRTLADPLQQRLGQPVVVENRPGADGIIGARLVAGAAPDGNVLLPATRSQVALNPVIRRDAGYDPFVHFAPITMLAHQAILVLVHPSVPARTVGEMIAHSRAHPGRLHYGSGATTFMFVAEAFKRATGADLGHVPYVGVPPSVLGAVAGDVQVVFADVTAALPQIRAGRLRVLAVMSDRRLAALPDVPTLGEAGVADFDAPVWLALFAPAGTPGERVERLRAAFTQVLAQKDVAEKLLDAGILPSPSTSQALTAFLRHEIARNTSLARTIGLLP